MVIRTSGGAARAGHSVRASCRSAWSLGLWAIASAGVFAQSNPSAPNPFVEELRQQERERALREQQEKAVDSRLVSDAKPEAQRLPQAERRAFGSSTRQLLGNRLAGAVIGVWGAFRGLNYDLFIGVPIRKPEGYQTAKVTGGFNLSFSFNQGRRK